VRHVERRDAQGAPLAQPRDGGEAPARVIAHDERKRRVHVRLGEPHSQRSLGRPGQAAHHDVDAPLVEGARAACRIGRSVALPGAPIRATPRARLKITIAGTTVLASEKNGFVGI
jgi:hypothetical protein